MMISVVIYGGGVVTVVLVSCYRIFLTLVLASLNWLISCLPSGRQSSCLRERDARGRGHMTG